ncbi:hypothetical protein [Pseudoalteromonas rubra]|uniref:ParB/Sulfiredoxin domain-containing protein n=1 Tax=Pseudoalteromonas rubra TaxID=43658 RepID=A0A0U3I3A7_9GAMM|nr:hypothetical protein [Pseudoalteromonas rubra]ALU44438.1 hypothetical protein AT705_16790 [Pseudoalteromonas rubra]
MNKLKLDQLMLANVNSRKGLNSETFEYTSLFLSSVTPDPHNARFLPAKFMEDDHARQFTSRWLTKNQLVEMYDANDHVLIGKNCIVNCFAYGTAQWKKANQTLESVLELAENISVAEVIQVPTVYPLEDGQYQILTGHRRFFAMVYSNGYDSSAQFKVYDAKPLLSKVKQFQENASRDDLPQYGKLQAFLSAMQELESLSQARLKVGEKKLTVKEMAANLGISMGSFDNYNVLTRYKCVIQAYEQGLVTMPFINVKKVVKQVENDYYSEFDKTLLTVTDKAEINKRIHAKLTGQKLTTKPKTKAFRVKPIQHVETIKMLLTHNITELVDEVDWQAVDWGNRKAVTDTLAKVIEVLDNKSKGTDN